MRRFRRSALALLATATGLGGLAVTGGTASAAHEAAPPCMVVTSDTTLTADVGPCDGHGIVVQADDVTLDLGGHSVTGAKQAMEQAGILLDGVTGVTVKNGSVSGFDAGVSIEGGGGNRVTGLDVHDNVNDMIEPIDPRSILIDRETGPTPEQLQQMALVTCDYGDGITTLDSGNNVIEGNNVVGNGPYGGITLVADSNGNVVRGNHVAENDLLNNGVTDAEGNPVWVLDGVHVPAGTPGASQPQSMCGATEIGTPGMGRGRQVQSIGIRVEGPGADGNTVEGNTVVKGGLAGISFHSYVVNPAAGNVDPGVPNVQNTVRHNDVSRTGEDTATADSFADGIASLASGPVGRVTHPSNSNTIVANRSHDNARHGISLGRLSFDYAIEKNHVVDNGAGGIWVAGPTEPQPDDPDFDARGAHDNVIRSNHGKGNAEADGIDENPNCDDNVWLANKFRTVNQPCVATGGPPGLLKAGGHGADGPGGGMMRGHGSR